MPLATGTLHERTDLRDRVQVFAGRTHAGKVLADMLKPYHRTDTLVLGIPAGGLPVAAEIARCHQLEFDVAVVSKMTLPWNTEVGFGAVAFDGSVQLNEVLIPQFRLTKSDIQQVIEKTTAKVNRRVKTLRGERPLPSLANRPVVLVDDGLASGFTMCVAIEAIAKAGAHHIIVAVPTAHARAVDKLLGEVADVYCANVRTGWSFAVADAYERWWDLDEEEISSILRAFQRETVEPAMSP